MIRLIRLQVARIEQLFYEGGPLLNYLALDGRRILKTIVSVSWNMLMKIKQDPAKVLLASQELSPAERFRFRLKHLMGLEGGVVVLPADADHDHH